MKKLKLIIIFWIIGLVNVVYIGPDSYSLSISPKRNWRKKNKKPKENEVVKSLTTASYFQSDQVILRYLKYANKEALIWRCKNAIKLVRLKEYLPSFDLYCETIGSVYSIDWYHDSKKVIDTERHNKTVKAHYANKKYYNFWLEFRLTIYNATNSDGGIYNFRLTSPKGDVDKRAIYVDLSKQKRHHKSYQLKKRRKYRYKAKRRRNRRRRKKKRDKKRRKKRKYRERMRNKHFNRN